MHMALIYVGLGQKDLALSEFERGLTIHDGGLMYLTFDRRFASLREEPRFKDLIRAIGLRP